MVELRQSIGISFRELELSVFQKLQEMFAKAMRDVLKELDAAILHLRDKERYEVNDIRTGGVPTLLGDLDVAP